MKVAAEYMVASSPDFLDPPVKHPALPRPYPIGCEPQPTVLVRCPKFRRSVHVSERDYDPAIHGRVLAHYDADGRLIDDGGL